MNGNGRQIERSAAPTFVCGECGKEVDKFHYRWEPCVLRGESRTRLAVTHLNQVLARTKDGDAVTRGFMEDARENGSWAEVYKDGEIPVSRRSVTRKTFFMGKL